MNPQHIAILLQAIHALGMGQRMGIGSPNVGGISRPGRVHDTQLSHTSPILAPRQPLQAQTRGPSLGGRQTRADVEGRAAHPNFSRIEQVPSAASSAYMSLARGLPSQAGGMGKMTFGNMTKGKGAGNFGMR